MNTLDRLWQELPDYWLSIDPGGHNVGLSQWHGPVCIESNHTNPDAAVDFVVTQAASGRLGLLVYEKFILRPDTATGQLWSEFETSQMIGALRHVCRRAGVPCEGFRASDHKAIYKKPEFKPPERPLKEWASFRRGGHAKDSECLGEYWVRKTALKGRGY